MSSRALPRPIWWFVPLAGAFAVALVLVWPGGGGLPRQASQTALATSIDDVARFWESKVERDARDFIALNQLADTYIRRARQRGDVSDLSRAEAALRASIELGPSVNYGGVARLAAVYVEMHRFDQALPLAQDAIALKPTEAYAYGVAGDALLALGRYDEAGAAYGTMVTLAPGLVSFARLAALHEVSGDPSAAAREWRNAIDAATTRAEDAAWARAQYGHFLFDQGDLNAAHTQYRSAIEAVPGFWQAEAGLARVAAARGDLSTAAELYAGVVARRPDLTFVVALGDVYTALGADAKAAEQYALAEAIGRLYEANGVRSDLALARFLADHGSAETAVERARSAYAARPSVYAADALAWALHRAGRSSEAAPYVEEALRLDTLKPLFFYHAGMIRLALGDRPGAAEALGRALAMNPEFAPLYAAEAAGTLRILEASVRVAS